MGQKRVGCHAMQIFGWMVSFTKCCQWISSSWSCRVYKNRQQTNVKASQKTQEKPFWNVGIQQVPPFFFWVVQVGREKVSKVLFWGEWMTFLAGEEGLDEEGGEEEDGEEDEADRKVIHSLSGPKSREWGKFHPHHDHVELHSFIPEGLASCALVSIPQRDEGCFTRSGWVAIECDKQVWFTNPWIKPPWAISRKVRGVICGMLESPSRSWSQMSHEKTRPYFPLHWLFNLGQKHLSNCNKFVEFVGHF